MGRIEQAKRYPFPARKAGIEGVVTMRMRFDEAWAHRGLARKLGALPTTTLCVSIK